MQDDHDHANADRALFIIGRKSSISGHTKHVSRHSDASPASRSGRNVLLLFALRSLSPGKSEADRSGEGVLLLFLSGTFRDRHA